jgi:penicillin-insensitive murein DD-endopeptidase
MMRLRRVLLVACAIPVVAAAVFAGYVAWLGIDGGPQSVCHGTAANGSLESGRRLPHAGVNYRAYSTLGFLLGRTFVHESVRNAMRDAYAALSQSRPELRFIYAESGWPWGGRFYPHRTHANGTSADFHVPVRTLDGQPSELPTSPFNQFGYAVEFDDAGRAGPLAIDFQAMGLHLIALDQAARKNHIRIRRVIFDPRLQPKLAATEPGAQAMARLTFNRRPAWIRHDEHYHVDFDVPCR